MAGQKKKLTTARNRRVLRFRREWFDDVYSRYVSIKDAKWSPISPYENVPRVISSISSSSGERLTAEDVFVLMWGSSDIAVCFVLIQVARNHPAMGFGAMFNDILSKKTCTLAWRC